MKNPYEILGIDKDADDATIKKAYRKKAQAHHPDKEGGNTELFQEIHKSYEVLSDAIKRDYYDQTGSEKQEAASTIVLEALFSIILNVIQSSDTKTTNIIEVTKRILGNQQANHHNNKSNLNSQKLKLEEAAERFTIEEGQENFLQNALLNQARQINNAILQVENMIQVGEQILVLINKYQYRVDSTIQTFYNPFGGHFNTSSSTWRP